mgnify:CR=1 FL=1
MDTLLGICLGIGLSAACGFRVFVPLFIMGIASLAGHLNLAPGFEWIGTYPALTAFGVATCLEISGYYIPWIDNLLDTVAMPAAIVAGTIVMASSVSDMSPLLKWALAIIVGGGVAGTVQSATTITRLASTATTWGLANPIIATIEAGGSITLSILAVALPVFAAVGVIGVIYFGAKKIFERFQKNQEIKA